MSREAEEHEPPFIASAVLSVHRSPDGDEPFCAIVEARIPELSASTETPAVPRRGAEERDGGPRYDRPTARRACMRYGATSSNQREEERECPALLARYREDLKRRPPTADVGEIRALTARLFGPIDALFSDGGDLRTWGKALVDLVTQWAVEPGGEVLLYRAFAARCDDIPGLSEAPADGAPKPRRTRAHKPRPEFRSAADVIEVASRGTALGTGSIDFERQRAETRGRTRATWDEIYCHATPPSGARAKGLAAVEREATARHAIEPLGLSDADRLGIIDLARKRPLAERLLAYRARLIGWEPSPEQAIEFEEYVREQTAHLSDNEIRQRVASARRRLEEHLRKLPAIGRRALHEGRPDLLAGPEQLHGLIPERPTARR